MRLPFEDQERFLKNLSSTFVPLLDKELLKTVYRPLDLSVSNEELLRVDVSSAAALEEYIGMKIRQQGGSVGYGGYNERRNIYSRSAYFNQSNGINQRNIHLGLDLWCEAGTAVLAAHDAKVHSFKDNQNYGDYGPCIILEHEINGYVFYSLYGHLSRASLSTIANGQTIKSGEKIGELGTAQENGDYAPHLHFQLIMDMNAYVGDYPGVSNMVNLPYYLNNCPDPNLLLKIE